MIVMLNKHEQRLAKYLAKCRYQIARSAGVENQRVGPQPDWQTDQGIHRNPKGINI